jgi:hypothetical protein
MVIFVLFFSWFNFFLAEVVVVDDNVVVYKARGDVTLCIVADSDENELLLLSILNTFKDTLDILLKYVLTLHSTLYIYIVHI